MNNYSAKETTNFWMLLSAQKGISSNLTCGLEASGKQNRMNWHENVNDAYSEETSLYIFERLTEVGKHAIMTAERKEHVYNAVRRQK